MGTAIAYSENIYAVKTHLFLGGESLINVARRVGITAKLENVPSLPLGTNEINILEMAAGYSAFANLGYKVEPHFIERIEDSEGKVLYEAKNKKEAVLNPSITFILIIYLLLLMMLTILIIIIRLLSDLLLNLLISTL